MPTGNLKSQEIKRLTTPLVFKESKAYDCEGNLISCVETISEIKYIIEPHPGILIDDEILQYAPDSKAACRVRLNRGFGNFQDVLLIHESLPWIMALYYLILLSLSGVAIFARHTIGSVFLLILMVIPLLYGYYIFNLKNYKTLPKSKKQPKVETQKQSKTIETPNETISESSVESLKKYDVEVNNLKVLFDVKENVVRDLIEKRFQPPQITYDKFISMVDSCHKLFYNQVETANNITKLAVEDTPRIREELDNKIKIMKQIIDQIEDLTNELVININSDDESETEVKNLLDDMENLIDSVKDY